MRLINDKDNKIFYTNNIFDWILNFIDKNYIVITPYTKVSEIFSWKLKNPLRENYYDDLMSIFMDSINSDKLENSIINNNLSGIVEIDINFDKEAKSILKLSNEYVTSKIINKFITMCEMKSPEFIKILIIGFDDLPLEAEYDNVSISKLTSNIKKLTWDNLERIVILSRNEPIEIIDKDKFISWLEYESKTVLTMKQLNGFLSNDDSYDSYLISRIFNSII